MAITQARLKITLFLLFLTGILFLVYSNGLKTPFQSDDERHIFLNLEINNPAYYLNLVPDTGLLEKITLRQISLLAFALNYQWSQENPFGYHLFNILIHIFTVILVFTTVSLTIKNATEWGEKGGIHQERMPHDSQQVGSFHLFHLEHADDDGASDLLAVLAEDLYHDRISRRGLHPFVQSNGLEGHMGHAKVIAWLGIDGHFQFRVPRGDCVLVDRPTTREVCAIKTAVHDILWARIAADQPWELQ